MITPQDIQTKEFTHGVRGYKEDEVDIFLDEITADYDALILQNTQLKAQLEQLNAKVAEYREQETAVVKTLEAAKALMTDISASAEKRAEILIRNAEIDAASIVREAQEKLKALQSEEVQITSRIDDFKFRFKNMLESELALFREAKVPSAVVKSEREKAAEKQFNELLNSVPTAEQDFFDDKAFVNTTDATDCTIVSDREEK